MPDVLRQAEAVCTACCILYTRHVVAGWGSMHSLFSPVCQTCCGRLRQYAQPVLPCMPDVLWQAEAVCTACSAMYARRVVAGWGSMHSLFCHVCQTCCGRLRQYAQPVQPCVPDVLWQAEAVCTACSALYARRVVAGWGSMYSLLHPVLKTSAWLVNNISFLWSLLHCLWSFTHLWPVSPIPYFSLGRTERSFYQYLCQVKWTLWLYQAKKWQWPAVICGELWNVSLPLLVRSM